MFGKHSGLLPVRSAASEDLWRERAHELLTSRLPCELRAPCCHPMVLARLLLFVALWHTAEGGFAVGVEAAFLLLAGMQSGLSLVFLWLAVWVVGSSSATSSTFEACAAAVPFSTFLVVWMIILNTRC